MLSNNICRNSHKLLTCWLCCIVAAASLVACGSSSDEDASEPDASSQANAASPANDSGDNTGGDDETDPASDPAPEPDPDPEPDPEPGQDVPPPAAPSPPARAFPGAEGFGAFSRGGRGGEVYIVTNLDDSGTGSLRWALDQDGPRTIVFAVSGIIELNSELNIDKPWVTLAGQSSPAGITISGGRLKFSTHNVIVRGLRVRPGDDPDGMEPENRDGFSIGSTDPVNNIIIDHSSFTWAVDENGSNWNPNEYITVQWCIFAEGLRNSIHPEGSHSMGYIIGPGSRYISLHHNVFVSNEHRNPAIRDGRSIELINNVGYNWKSEGIAIRSTGSTTLHAINNHYAHGPDTTLRPAFYLQSSETGQHQVYLRGNTDSVYRPLATEGDEWSVAHSWTPEMRVERKVFSGSGIDITKPRDLLEVVLPAAGAISPQRDSIDARIIGSITANSGSVIDSPADVGGYEITPVISAPLDSDRDGMSDAWEIEQQLDPGDRSDRNSDNDNDGYTALEEYLNGLIG